MPDFYAFVRDYFDGEYDFLERKTEQDDGGEAKEAGKFHSAFAGLKRGAKHRRRKSRFKTEVIQIWAPDLTDFIEINIDNQVTSAVALLVMLGFAQERARASGKW